MLKQKGPRSLSKENLKNRQTNLALELPLMSKQENTHFMDKSGLWSTHTNRCRIKLRTYDVVWCMHVSGKIKLHFQNRQLLISMVIYLDSGIFTR